MSTLADRTIAALRANHEDLAAKVREFSEEDLATQSGATEWDVAQVLSHLGSGAEITLGGLQAAIEGAEPPGRSFNQSVWDRWNARSRQEQADGFLEANEALLRAFEDLDAEARERVQITPGFLPYPLSMAAAAGMRLNEAALHSWDVRVAFEPDASLSEEEADVLLDQFGGPLGFLLGFSGKPAALDNNEALLRVDTTDPQRSIGLRLGPTIGLEEAPREPDGVLNGPAEALLRLMAGRLRDRTNVSLDSDAVTLDQLATVFPGY